MNRFVIVGVIAVVLSAVGFLACSSTAAYCSAATTIGTTEKNKFGSCDAGGFTVGAGNCTNSNAASLCTTAYNQCSAADQTTLNNIQNCITNAPSCVPGMELSWFEALGSCEGDAGTVSSTCQGYFTAQFPDGGC